MTLALTQKEIGFRISELRKLKGFSQLELAQNLKISRPSLTQLELGNRSLDIMELQKLSQILGFSFNDFFSSDINPTQAVAIDEFSNQKKYDVRISDPKFNSKKAKNLLLYVLESCAGKPNIGELALHTILYFADFNNYELNENHLSGLQYKKLTNGPVVQKLDSIINQMIENKQIKRLKTTYQHYAQIRYLPLVKPNLSELLASEKEVVDRVLELMGDWSTSALIKYVQMDMPLQATKEGDVIEYELVFYRDAPFSVRNYEE